MIERVCDQNQVIKHSLNFILKKSLSKTDLTSRSYVNCIFVNPVNLQNLGTLRVEQFPNRTSNNCFLKRIFLSSNTRIQNELVNASILKKVSQNRTKYCNKQNKTNNNKRPFFLPKINKVFSRPILQNLKGRSVLDNFFFENDPLDEPNQM